LIGDIAIEFLHTALSQAQRSRRSTHAVVLCRIQPSRRDAPMAAVETTVVLGPHFKRTYVTYECQLRSR
jgi:hypothetical protein